ncbi:TrmH family RNA methyltransferase [Candidatus Saccharibacteria bacterium]|nr:TrmH family RNA methyltransferase [Candidatus Saccharibacteria bacterium]
MEEDTRNLMDEYKGLPNEEVKARLATKRNALEIAIENVSHDFNAGTIVRNANNFNAAKVHIVGRHKYNRRGAMCTDKYLEICYWPSIEEFMADQRARGREVVAIECNVPGCKPLGEKVFKEETTLLLGSESDGLTSEILKEVDDIRFIESFGSTRSVNVGVASGIAMYEWARQNKIQK